MSWASTFARFHAGRIPLVGPLVVRVTDWSKPRPGRGPMFDQRVLERLSVAHPMLPTVTYAPIGVLLLFQAVRSGMGANAVVVCYILGMVAWSFFEYGVHRLAFHHEPATSVQVAGAYLVHGVHHAYPDDSRRWVMPLAVTAPIATALFFAFRLVLGRCAPATYAGFISGYLTYDLLHYFIHRGRLPTRLGRYLRQYHLAHHYKMADRNFGVTSPLWDVVFRTK